MVDDMFFSFFFFFLNVNEHGEDRKREKAEQKDTSIACPPSNGAKSKNFSIAEPDQHRNRKLGMRKETRVGEIGREMLEDVEKRKLFFTNRVNKLGRGIRWGPACLPTLPVFPVDYRKSGPATGLPKILWFLPDFNQPGTSVQKKLDSCRSAPSNCWKDEGK